MDDQLHERESSTLDSPSSVPDASFHMVVAHLYRAEMTRMTVWRRRLDTTTNWAILLTTGMVTWALGAVSVPHYVLLLGLALIGFCLLVEARRFQHLHHSRWRLQLMERSYFGEALHPGATADEEDWRRVLSADLRRPRCTIRRYLAVRVRLRRNYLMLVYFVTGVWITKLFIHPTNVQSVAEYYERLSVGALIPSWFVATTAAVFVVVATLLAMSTPSDEVLEHWAGRENG